MSNHLMYVFGVWPGHKRGHHLRTASGDMIERRHAVLPWPDIDGTMPPYGDRATMAQQVEGVALLHHLEGWTALAFWDRSEDRRGGSNTVFFVRAHLSAEEMLTACRARFPAHFARYRFDVVVKGTSQ